MEDLENKVETCCEGDQPETQEAPETEAVEPVKTCCEETPSEVEEISGTEDIEPVENEEVPENPQE